MNPAQRLTEEGILFADANQLSMIPLCLRIMLRKKQAYFNRVPQNDTKQKTVKIGYCTDSGLKRPFDWHTFRGELPL